MDILDDDEDDDVDVPPPLVDAPRTYAERDRESANLVGSGSRGGREVEAEVEVDVEDEDQVDVEDCRSTSGDQAMQK